MSMPKPSKSETLKLYSLKDEAMHVKVYTVVYTANGSFGQPQYTAFRASAFEWWRLAKS